ncbi:murein L,D-transpeptidase catalytic domain-containing protein [Flammeovirga sp. OC4]|uniref:murein L,D-transpeptidase catalytic domain-containing protein n=1 Tax=Flammeovirga sp. OC4 TaxID=1382345 RepID=UPI0005C654D9|nr:murein L,D-transpeptidase catalytic domain family protein [Flammeovirga sp. OC4]
MQLYPIFLLLLLFSIDVFCQEDESTTWNDDWDDITFTEENKYECDSINFSLTEIQQRVQQKAEKALTYCKENNLSQNYCILIDMGIHSGNLRFFVYDFAKKEVIKKALVAHGCGDAYWSDDQTRAKPQFSNVPESHLSSLGKYRMGKRGVSSWGIKINYKMHGLESTNSNAYKRIIVLHSWERVKDKETFPIGTPEGWGCPAVSNDTMRYLDTLLKQNKNMLMWIYE